MISTIPVVTELRFPRAPGERLCKRFDNVIAGTDTSSSSSSSGVRAGEVRPDSFLLSVRNWMASDLASSTPYVFELKVLLRRVVPSIQKANQACMRRFQETPRHPDLNYKRMIYW